MAVNYNALYITYALISIIIIGYVYLCMSMLRVRNKIGFTF